MFKLLIQGGIHRAQQKMGRNFREKLIGHLNHGNKCMAERTFWCKLLSFLSPLFDCFDNEIQEDSEGLYFEGQTKSMHHFNPMLYSIGVVSEFQHSKQEAVYVNSKQPVKPLYVVYVCPSLVAAVFREFPSV